MTRRIRWRATGWAAELAITVGVPARAANGEATGATRSSPRAMEPGASLDAHAHRDAHRCRVGVPQPADRVDLRHRRPAPGRREYWRDIQAHRADGPLFEPQSRTVTPCASRPAPADQPARVGNGVPALIVNAAGDIDALLPMGRAMHRALTGSVMITPAGVRDHMVYLLRVAPCVDDAVDAYLASGRLPAADTTCAG